MTLKQGQLSPGLERGGASLRATATTWRLQRTPTELEEHQPHRDAACPQMKCGGQIWEVLQKQAARLVPLLQPQGAGLPVSSGAGGRCLSHLCATGGAASRADLRRLSAMPS